MLLVQIAAVRGALDRVARIILDEHLTECVARAAEAGNIDVEIAQLKAALDRFLDWWQQFSIFTNADQK